MSSTPRSALALLDSAHPDGFRPASPIEPHLSVLDLAATRGDGVFETVGVRSGRPQALDAHLARFLRSAASLDLPEPSVAHWRAAVLAIADELSDLPFAVVKIVLSRGVEGSEASTGWVHGREAPDHSAAQTDGIDVVLLDRGYRHDVAATAPWLLQGAKTLSYAVNTAALREAARRGADDVVFLSSDGVVLEGPTSTVLLLRGATLVTPGPALPILAGTTQAAAFDFAASIGLETAVEHLRVEHLRAADALWLLSSVRLAAPVRSIDSRAIAIDTGFTERLNGYLGERRE